jgi:valyl-tRNA synthetase
LVFFLALANVGFGGIMDPESEDFKYYYPTNDLVTGPDILFFWVARMIIAVMNIPIKPFTNVYLTGLVRDKQRRKMSKSLETHQIHWI